MSLKLLKFSVYLDARSLCGPILKAEEYDTGLGSWHLICGISFWQPYEMSKYYCYLFPVGNWRQGWFLAHLKHLSLNQNFGMSCSELLRKTKAFSSVQYYNFILKVFCLTFLLYFHPGIFQKKILCWHSYEQSTTKIWGNVLEINGHLRILWLIIIS